MMEFLPVIIIWIVIALITAGKKGNKATGSQQTGSKASSAQSSVNRTSTAQSSVSRTKAAGSQSAGNRAKASGKAGSNTSGTVRKNETSKTSESTVARLKREQAEKEKDIVTRARTNASKLKEDETLKEIEDAHGHSEAEHAMSEGHSRNCQARKKDGAELVEESYLGTTEDLMVKGYSGDMHFDRDFVGEAMDMLTAISGTPSGN